MLARFESEMGYNLLRLGKPDVIDQNNKKYLLYSKIEQLEHYKELEDEINRRVKKKSRKNTKDLISLKNELIKREVEAIIEKTNIVFTTINGSRPENIIERYIQDVEKKFDVVIIDEAAQVSELQTWLSILNAPKFIMAGDDRQSRAFFDLDEPTDDLEESLFEKLYPRMSDQMKISLDVQFRMNDRICDFPSKRTYAGLLVCDDICKDWTLKTLKKDLNANIHCPILEFLNTDLLKDENHFEEKYGTSYLNQLEIDIVNKVVKYLLDNFKLKNGIGVITPYAEQRNILKENFIDEQVEISSVDGFQGKEKEVIILSFVRCNFEGYLGFVDNERRLNVSMTRAKRALIMVGSKNTLTKSNYMTDYFKFGRINENNPNIYF